MTVKVGIIGCGKIADQHAAHISRMSGCKIIGVCDLEPLMAQQLAERYQVSAVFSNVDDLLSIAKPDVIHITTPPQSHFGICKQSLEAGCHVYVEKPFTVDADEAQDLITLAQKSDRYLTVGHNVMFNPEMLAMQQEIQNDFLGGSPVHIESVFSYDLGDARYVKALLGDKTHWVRKLPGKLLHNIISHGIAKIAQFIKIDNPLILTHGLVSHTLQTTGEVGIVDELRVIISDRTHTTAYFTFTTQFAPAVQELRIFGPRGTLVVDSLHRTLVKQTASTSNYKSQLNFIVPSWIIGLKYIKNSFLNVHRFYKAEAHADVGMKNLIEAFYKSIVGSGVIPIPYDEILATTRIMDEIFRQLTNDKISA